MNFYEKCSTRLWHDLPLKTQKKRSQKQEEKIYFLSALFHD